MAISASINNWHATCELRAGHAGGHEAGSMSWTDPVEPTPTWPYDPADPARGGVMDAQEYAGLYDAARKAGILPPEPAVDGTFGPITIMTYQVHMETRHWTPVDFRREIIRLRRQLLDQAQTAPISVQVENPEAILPFMQKQIREAKAQALREAADALPHAGGFTSDWWDGVLVKYEMVETSPDDRTAATYLRKRADEIEAGEGPFFDGTAQPGETVTDEWNGAPSTTLTDLTEEIL